MNECPYCGDRWTGDQLHPCCLEAAGPDAAFRLTPKGRVIVSAQNEGLTADAGVRIWEALESHCAKMLTGDDEFPALIFDGEGGTVIGADHHSEND